MKDLVTMFVLKPGFHLLLRDLRSFIEKQQLVRKCCSLVVLVLEVAIGTEIL